MSRSHVYSVGLADCVNDLRQPFHEIEDEVVSDLEGYRNLYLALVGVVSFCFTLYICLVSVLSDFYA